MANAETDIGYCISKVLMDYSVQMEPDVCVLLSSPLWLGMNIGEGHAYSPVDRDVIAYLNPLFLESFSVNSNSLFLPVRGNSKDHLAYLVQRLKNRRKTLVKLSGNVFESGDCDRHSPAVPVLGVIENITEQTGATGVVIEIAFSGENTLMMSEEEFINYWYSGPVNKINTEWFTLIPSQNKVGGPLMEMKLRAAIVRQCHHLKASYGSVITGSAVLEYLKDQLTGKIGRYREPASHFSLWQKARGIVGLRRRYVAAMDHIECSGIDAGCLEEGVANSVQAWEEFYTELDRDIRAEQLARLYDMLMARENEMTGQFKAMA